MGTGEARSSVYVFNAIRQKYSLRPPQFARSLQSISKYNNLCACFCSFRSFYSQRLRGAPSKSDRKCHRSLTRAIDRSRCNICPDLSFAGSHGLTQSRRGPAPGVFQGHVKDAVVLFRCAGEARNPPDSPRSRSPHTIPDWLDRASDAFCQRDEIVAGYPWFCESWGRDSAISVTGLLIERGRRDEARAVLNRLSGMIRDGVIPNRFPDNYHTSDASLWFIHALTRTAFLGGRSLHG